MSRISMKVVAAVLAASLRAVTGLSGGAAHDPGHGGGGPGFPGTSAKPLPSGWTWPSDLPSHAVKTHMPDPSKAPEASKAPKPTKPPKLPANCTPVVTPTSSPVVGLTSLKTSAFGVGKDEARAIGIWDQRIGLLQGHIDATFDKVYCAPIPLQKTLDAQISGRIKTIQSWVKQVDGSGLGTSDKATVDAELNGLISGLQTLKTKVDSETTLAALQADYQTLKSEGTTFRTVELWVQEIVGVEKLISSEAKLTTLEATIATGIAGAPAGPETTDAQLFLNDMKSALANGEALVSPLPAQLLAITPTQLSDGSATPILTSVRVQLAIAKWDFNLAGWAAKWAQQEIKQASATPKPTVTPKPTATPTV